MVCVVGGGNLVFPDPRQQALDHCIEILRRSYLLYSIFLLLLQARPWISREHTPFLSGQPELITPHPGMFVLWPASLLHHVHPHVGDEPRHPPPLLHVFYPFSLILFQPQGFQSHFKSSTLLPNNHPNSPSNAISPTGEGAF